MITLLLVLKLLQFTKLTLRILFIYLFFLSLEKVKIPNYNKCKLLIFTQKIKEPLSMRSQLLQNITMSLLPLVLQNT